MNRYSVSDAIFFATSYDRKSRHFWRLAMAYLLSKLIFFAIVLSAIYPFAAEAISVIANTEIWNEKTFQDPEFLSKVELLSNFSTLGGLLFLPIFLMILASFYHWTLNDDVRRSWLGLGYGKAALNLLVVYIAIYGIFLIFMFLLLIPVVAAITAVVFATDNGDGPNVALTVLVVVTAIIGVMAALFWLGVKLSIAPALSVRDSEIRIFESFSATRGHFWKLLGSYLLLYLVVMVVGLIMLMAVAFISAPFIVVGVSQIGFSPGAEDLQLIIKLAVVPLISLFVLSTIWEYWSYISYHGIAAYFLKWKAKNSAEPPTNNAAPAHEATVKTEP